MSDKIYIHFLLVIILSIGSLGLALESLLEGWEFWMPPALFFGTVVLWIIHIRQYGEEKFREGLFLCVAIVESFLHGVHETSFFDIAVISVLFFITFSLLDNISILEIIYATYIVILGMQLSLALHTGSVRFDRLNLSRLVLHVVVVTIVFFLCRLIVKRRLFVNETIAKMDEEKISVDHDREDFLSNISHELRTPVNVVNGMSTLILKNGEDMRVEAIRKAGIRLSEQISDIQDHTEIERGELILEEEKYMVTSLVNDVITGYLSGDRKEGAQVIIDLAPDVPAVLKGDYKKLHRILRHLLDNAIKFTKSGGILVGISAITMDYGINLVIEVTDTGRGMTAKEVANASERFYQGSKKRNRSSGGIGLGLPIVYGFVHKMGGFVNIESTFGVGTTVHVTLPQEVVDPSPCLSVSDEFNGNIVMLVNPAKFDTPEVREFYRVMAVNIAQKLHCPLYAATNKAEFIRIMERIQVTHLFMGEEEYAEDPEFFEKLSHEGVVVSVSVKNDTHMTYGKNVITLPKPLYGYPLVRVINEGTELIGQDPGMEIHPYFDGLRVLIVDDEPMNLVVATGLFKEYHMITDTAESGREAIEKYKAGKYDVVFMDHMMPEMDGVEAMKRLKEIAEDENRFSLFVALTANAVSGAREMFMREGFDGFISKPIDIAYFERVMKNLLPERSIHYEGGDQ